MLVYPDAQVITDAPKHLSSCEELVSGHKDTLELLARSALFKKTDFPPQTYPPCSAGSRYFRVYNSGDIVPCEYLESHAKIHLGNLKKRDVITLKDDVNCNVASGCDCGWSSSPRVVLLNSLNKPYARRVLYQYESIVEACAAPLPVNMDGLSYFIDRLQIEGRNTHSVGIEGWAFIKGETALGSEIRVILQSAQQSYTVTSRTIQRPDVSSHFSLDGLDASGFQTFVPYDRIEAGSYRVGIQVKKGDIEAVVYTDRILNV